MKEKLEDSQHATNRLELETLTLISDRLCPTGHRTVLLAPLLVGKANIISRWYYTFISEFINCLHAEGSWSGRELYLVCGGVHTNPVDIVLQERAEQLANEAKAKAYALSMAEKLTPPNLILTRAIMEHPRHHQQTKQNKTKIIIIHRFVDPNLAHCHSATTEASLKDHGCVESTILVQPRESCAKQTTWSRLSMDACRFSGE